MKRILSRYMKEIEGYKKLTKEQEKDLHKKLKNGCKKSYDIFFKSNLRLCIKIANKNIGRGVELLDLIQSASIGLILAIERFDPDLDFKFSTYATHWIKQQTLHCIYKDGKTIKININDRKLIRDYNDNMLTGFYKRKAELLLLYTFDVIKISDLNSNDESQDDFIDKIKYCSIKTPIENVLNSEINKKLNHSYSFLEKRELEIIISRFGLFDNDKKTLEQLAIDHNLSGERIRQIESKALNKMKKNLQDCCLLD